MQSKINNIMKMKRFLILFVVVLMAQGALAQQFSLPILPQKMWPSDYAKYESDVLNCCNWLINTNPEFNAPKHQECSSFLVRWTTGSPDVHIAISADLVDVKKSDLLIVYLAAWTRQQIQNKGDNAIICANVAVEEVLRFYSDYKDYIGKSKLTDNLLKIQKKGTLPTYINQKLNVGE